MNIAATFSRDESAGFCVPDIFSKEKRSEIMSKIRSKGTKIELRMKKALEETGVEFEYQPKMFGRPDFFVPPNIAVFCDSSFWHGRNWRGLIDRSQSSSRCRKMRRDYLHGNMYHDNGKRPQDL